MGLANPIAKAHTGLASPGQSGRHRAIDYQHERTPVMDDQTTGPTEASGDSGQPDFQAKYKGLQSAFQKRQNEFSAKETAWAEEREQLAANAAKLDEYEARETAEREEAEALAMRDTLNERFKTEPPTPTSPNQSNHDANPWGNDRYPRKDADEAPKSSGYPT